MGHTAVVRFWLPADGSIAIVLTQVELGGPQDGLVLESFWSAAAAHLQHNT